MEAKKQMQRNLNIIKNRPSTIEIVDKNEYRNIAFKPIREGPDMSLDMKPIKRFEMEYTNQNDTKFNGVMASSNLQDVNRMIREYDKAINKFEAEIASHQFHIDQNIIKINYHKDLRNKLIAKRAGLINHKYLFYDFRCDIEMATNCLSSDPANNIRRLVINFDSIAKDLIRNHQCFISVDKNIDNNKYTLYIKPPTTILNYEVMTKIKTLDDVFNMLNLLL